MGKLRQYLYSLFMFTVKPLVKADISQIFPHLLTLLFPLSTILKKREERKHSSLLAEVSHDKAKMRERRETSAGFRRVSYHACAGISLTTSDVFLTCDTTHRTGLRAKLQLKARVYVVENSSQCETMPTTPQSRKFGESASTRTPIKPVGSGKDVRYLLRGLDFKGERC